MSRGAINIAVSIKIGSFGRLEQHKHDTTQHNTHTQAAPNLPLLPTIIHPPIHPPTMPQKQQVEDALVGSKTDLKARVGSRFETLKASLLAISLQDLVDGTVSIDALVENAKAHVNNDFDAFDTAQAKQEGAPGSAKDESQNPVENIALVPTLCLSRSQESDFNRRKAKREERKRLREEELRRIKEEEKRIRAEQMNA